MLVVLKMYCITVSDFESHPVTKDIEDISIYCGIPITQCGSGKALAKTSEDTWDDMTGEGAGSVEENEDSEEGLSNLRRIILKLSEWAIGDLFHIADTFQGGPAL